MKRQKKNQDDDNGFGEWGGYMEAKILKLEEQYLEQLKIFKKTDLFAGISIFVNGYTKPSADELKRIMLTNGGIFHHYQRPHTSFIIASNLPDVKIKILKMNHKIVKPEWIVDCIKENKILDYSNYLLYTNKTAQPKLYMKRQKSSILKDGNNTKINDSQSSITDELNILNEKLMTDNIFDAKVKTITINDDSSNDSSNASSTILIPLHSPNNSDSDTESIPEDVIIKLTENEKFAQHTVSLKEDSLDTELTRDKSILNETKSTNSNVALTAADPNFIKEFFNNSRLHHIATLGANFKQLINDLREKHNGTFPHRKTIKESLNPDLFDGNLKHSIMHIDMDCFFVSVGLRSRPHLQSLPVAVTHSKGSNAGQSTKSPGVDRQCELDLYQKRMKDKLTKDGISADVGPSRLDGIDNLNSMAEIASCSYEARKMGIKNGMFVGAALKLCPNLHTIPYDFEEYKNVANELYNTVAQYTLDIEAVSCDEMFVDLTKLLEDLSVTCWSFVEHLRQEIQNKTGCPCSAGVGENKLQARIATRVAKPNGQYIMELNEVDKLIATLSVSDLPGVGFNTVQKLKNLNCSLCSDLKEIKLPVLQKEFGVKMGQKLYDYSRGIDKNPLVYNHIRKTVSAEVNYGIRLNNQQQVDNFLKQLCEEVHRRLTEINKRGKGITLKLMVRSKEAPVETAKFMGHGICDTITKSTNLNYFTNDLSIINASIAKMIKQINILPKELRGIGIHITNLDNTNKKETTTNTIVSMFNQEATVNNKDKIEVKDSNDNKYKRIVDAMKPSCSWATSPVKSNPGFSNNYKNNNDYDMPYANTYTNAYTNTSDDMSNLCNYGFDIEVLKELPPNIVKEILHDERLREQQKVISKPCKALVRSEKPNNIEKNNKTDDGQFDVDEFLEELPPELRTEVARDLQEQKHNFNILSLLKEYHKENKKQLSKKNETLKIQEISKDNILLQDWRQILQEWLNSTNAPDNSDVDIISSNIKQFILAKNISDIYVVLRFLQRIISEKEDCGWHKAYYRIVESVQQQMNIAYNGELKIPEDIECKELCYLLYKNKSK